VSRISLRLLAWPKQSPAAFTFPAAASIKSGVPSSAAFRFRASFIHIKSPARELRAIQLGNGFLTLLRIRHLDERKSTRPTGITIGHECDSIYLPELREQLTKVIFCNVEIEIANKDIFHGELLQIT
jgi:hypothetical protein